MHASVRRPDSRPRLLAAAMAAVAVAALSLTACGAEGKGEGVRQEGAASPQASAAAPQPSGPAQGAQQGAPGAKSAAPAASTSHRTHGTGGTNGKGGTTGTDGKGGASRDPYAPENRVDCSTAAVEVVATPVSRPLNHMLLTLTNKGSKMCDLKGYPVVKFEGAQSVPPVIEGSEPQAVTSLKPGAKGYAGVILSSGEGSGGKGYTAQSLQVGFEGSDRMVDAALQAKGVHVDNALRVTYWVTSPGDALN
ncbi:hypothetical protein B7P34_13620 [Streptosporangium nondiastaticum]|uniref:DUF4232 domain-containing protein n=1 Tax=Streptosporangium nondiastaticum TaxID=35764 RepID=A0A9X7JQS4_9ACTN|nr:DUF4232 domain-containing protein [Streptosporangium nondiastaticum]PSJ28157.1 hypothetical protein B7P34_13620 [Streptosporangium nondiastaticum]